jgi:hypothetical protein
MAKEVGLWIDQTRAFVVTVTDDGAEVQQIESYLDGSVHPGALWPVRPGTYTGSQQMFPRRLTGRLDKYYDQVMWFISDATAIAIFGPGDAKTEVVKRLEARRLGRRIIAVEAATHMTQPQIVARVRDCFAEQRS